MKYPVSSIVAENRLKKQKRYKIYRKRVRQLSVAVTKYLRK
jgi:hypothetical protein